MPMIKVSSDAIKISANKKELDQRIASANYYGVLIIDKIDLKQEFYPVTSNKNHVDQNIYLHPSSIMPGNETSHIIIAGHSGNGVHAYFKDLYHLEVKDEVKVYFDEKVWNYEIEEIEYQDKTGVLYLKDDYSNMITLITCTKGDSKKQTIYYGFLKSSQKL